jgi:hypothetical protein
MKDIDRYDPAHAPDPKGWLGMDEAERIELVLKFHRHAKERLPSPRLHASLHVIVENQVALGDEIPVRRTIERLQAEGLNRHDAVHAVDSVLAKQVFDLMKGGRSEADLNLAYGAELEGLSAERWRRAR